MSRWTDLAVWVGPTVNRNAGGMASPPRGVVLHIASGFYDGTISWQRRSTGSGRTSSHFIVGRDGRCAQMVDTADASWAQKSGNGTWLSVELEGFAPEDPLHKTHPLWETATPQQLEVCARLLAKAHQVHGVPLQLAVSPSGRGLGHHSMGAETGTDWGHSACPGAAIKVQKAAILARAKQLVAGPAPSPNHEEDDMAPILLAEGQKLLPLCIPPAATRLHIGGDFFSDANGVSLRVWLTKGDGSFSALPGYPEGIITVMSGRVASVDLPPGTRLVSVSRWGLDGSGRPVGPDTAGATVPKNPVSLCVERA